MKPRQHSDQPVRFGLRHSLALAICILLSVSSNAALTRDRYTASEVSVALLYNVTKFVRWPDGSFDNDDSPLKICAFPSQEYLAPLQALEKHRLRSRTIELVEVSGEDSIADLDCHVWFFTPADREGYRETLSKLQGSGVLTVGNFREFAEHGGMLSLAKGRKRVNIRINSTASARAGVEYNAQLLELATVFEQEEELARQ